MFKGGRSTGKFIKNTEYPKNLIEKIFHSIPKNREIIEDIDGNALKRLFETLDEQDIQILNWRYVEKMTFKEMGIHLGGIEKARKSHLKVLIKIRNPNRMKILTSENILYENHKCAKCAEKI